jgi:hypothetical protein
MENSIKHVFHDPASTTTMSALFSKITRNNPKKTERFMPLLYQQSDIPRTAPCQKQHGACVS